LSLCCLSPSRLVLFCISLFEGTVVKEEAWLTVRNRIALFINLKSQGILGMAGLPEQAIADFEDIRQRVIAHAFRKCVRFAISLRVHRAAADETIVDVIARVDLHKQWRCTTTFLLALLLLLLLAAIAPHRCRGRRGRRGRRFVASLSSYPQTFHAAEGVAIWIVFPQSGTCGTWSNTVHECH
jgi:hypothetical protein